MYHINYVLMFWHVWWVLASLAGSIFCIKLYVFDDTTWITKDQIVTFYLNLTGHHLLNNATWGARFILCLLKVRRYSLSTLCLALMETGKCTSWNMSSLLTIYFLIRTSVYGFMKDAIFGLIQFKRSRWDSSCVVSDSWQCQTVTQKQCLNTYLG